MCSLLSGLLEVRAEAGASKLRTECASRNSPIGPSRTTRLRRCVVELFGFARSAGSSHGARASRADEGFTAGVACLDSVDMLGLLFAAAVVADSPVIRRG